jgi:Ca2+-binding EF-hand superfamily protein/CRP-like cAMP-binding protein
VQHNKDYVKSLGVLALPSVHLYAGKAGLVESFACGPSKVPILKRKLVQLVNDRVDTNTRQLKDITNGGSEESEPCAARPVMDSTTTAPETQLNVGGVVVSQKMMDYMRNDVPYFKDLSEQEFTDLMQKAKLLSFDAGSVIMRQGRPGRLFYVMESGEVEICVKAAFEDPLTTPSSYLGTVINTLNKKNFFGERALITGEPRAASIRATEKVRAFAFDIDDIPASSLLSGKKSVPEDFMQTINERYDLDFYNIDLIKDQFKQANMGNQVRGSVNRPEKIVGVDVAAEESLMQISEQDKETILPLLVRFRMVRNAARCFNYIMSTNPLFGDPGEIRRRTMLVSRLSSSQKEEFKETFDLIDSDDNGLINLIELKRVMESVGEIKSDEELLSMINKGNVALDGNQEITFVDFMGIMAEAEFYQLFKDTFSALDTHNSGFVKAADLDRVLCGMRDLISDDKHSIIDIEDNEMLIDYEQFSRMLLGTHG